MKIPREQNIMEKVILIVVNETELVDFQLKPNTGLQIHDDLGSLSDSVWQPEVVSAERHLNAGLSGIYG